jgi:predicted phosphoribosyltransferase
MYKNRTEAGVLLARVLVQQDINNPCLLAIPRGGVAVAAPIAEKLKTAIHLLVTHKIGHPLQGEVAIGAVMPDGCAVWDQKWLEVLALSEQERAAMIHREFLEIKRRVKMYTGLDQAIDIMDKQVIIVDDGIATGHTIRAAISWLKRGKAQKIILAAPVAPADTVAELKQQVDDVLCPRQLSHFRAVGMYYEDFTQVTDMEVLDILHAYK